jgi:hypothetical protein
MVESQFLLHPRAGPALEAGVIFFCVEASKSLAASSDAIWYLFSMLVQWGMQL